MLLDEVGRLAVVARVRLPSGTAHALAARTFPIAVMGKTGTTDEFRDAIFVGSTYGPDGITAAVRIGFDDNRSLGSAETGGRLALPVFQELMAGVYRDKLVGGHASVSGRYGSAHYGLPRAADGSARATRPMTPSKLDRRSSPEILHWRWCLPQSSTTTCRSPRRAANTLITCSTSSRGSDRPVK